MSVISVVRYLSVFDSTVYMPHIFDMSNMCSIEQMEPSLANQIGL